MGSGKTSIFLFAFCLGVAGLHAQNPADRPFPTNTGKSSTLPYPEAWRQMHRRPANLRGGTFARPHAAADSDAEVSPNFAGFYTAPFIHDVAPVTAGANRMAFLTADVNHDGHPDLLSIDSSGEIAAAINDGVGHFATPAITAPTVATTNTVDAIASDVNGDGYPDVVVLTGGVPANNGPGPQQFIVLVNQKDGTFKATATLSPANNTGLYSDWNPFNAPLAWTVGSTSTTGLPDIVAEYLVIAPGSTAATFTRTVFPNDGSGGFSDATQSTATVPLSGSYFSPNSFLTAPRLVLADVNHDGKPDILTAYVLPLLGPFQVDIALGNGNGTFAAPLSNAAISVPYGSGFPNATSLALASVSGSTSPAPDLLLSGDNSVFLAASNGDGTYKAPVLITEKSFKRSGSIAGFRVADVNGDGLPDLLVIGNGSLTTLLGKGNRSFDPAVNTVVTNSGDTYDTGMVFADFDGDGKLDCITDSSASPDVVMSKGFGDGNFAGSPFFDASAASIPSGNFAVIAALDLNGDGKTDLIGIDALNGDIYAAIATSSGRFTFKATLPQISLNTFIESYTADFNGDGKSDLVVEQQIDGTAPSYISTFKVGVALSNGNGSFQDPVYATLPAAISADPPYGIAAGDLNGDGKMDLVLAYFGQGTTGQEPGGYCVALGKGDGSFSPATFTAFGASPFDVLLGHFHGNKSPLDLVISDTGQRLFATSQVSILKGNGDGTFGAGTAISSGQRSSGLLSADFNKDGNPDLIIPINFAYGQPPLYAPNFDQDGVALYTGHGDGSFSTPTTIAPGSNPYYPITADVNGDGNLDILYDSSGAGVDDGLTVLLGHGDGTFAAATRYPMPLQSYLAAGNFLGDNAQSLIAGIPGSGAALVMNLGGTVVTLASASSTITAQVAPTLSGRPVPTGTGTFLEGTTVLGSSPLANGAGGLDASGLAAGTHTITFEYSGDENFQPNTASSTITVTATAPDFSIGSSSASITVTPGQTGTAKLAIMASAGLSGMVSFTCSGLPAESTCAFAPAKLTVSPGMESTTTLSISTTAPAAAAAHAGRTMLALGLLCIIPLCSGGRRPWIKLSLLAGAFVLVGAGLAGCGGSSSQQTSPNGGSPTGNYTVTVTATSGSGSSAITHTLPLTVVIQ